LCPFLGKEKRITAANSNHAVHFTLLIQEEGKLEQEQAVEQEDEAVPEPPTECLEVGVPAGPWQNCVV
jgi:hypothetical protein